MLSLNRHRRQMSRASRRLLSRRWTPIDPTVAPVIADAVYRGLVDHRRVVNIVNDGNVHVIHRTVVKEAHVLPTSTFIAFTEITESVNDPAIETYLRHQQASVEEK